MNTYGYALQNPVRITDPTGLNPLCPALVAADGPLPIGDAVCGLLIIWGINNVTSSGGDDNVTEGPWPGSGEGTQGNTEDDKYCPPGDPDGPSYCELWKNSLDIAYFKIKSRMSKGPQDPASYKMREFQWEQSKLRYNKDCHKKQGYPPITYGFDLTAK